MEDAEKIMAEFKRREAIVDTEMEKDRKAQRDALEEKLAARRAKREKRKAEITGQQAFRAKMEDSNVDTTAVSNKLIEDIAPLFEPAKEEEIVVEVDEEDKAAISQKETEVTDMLSGLDKKMEEEKKAKEEEEERQKRERKRIQGILDEEEKRRLLEQL